MSRIEFLKFTKMGQKFNSGHDILNGMSGFYQISATLQKEAGTESATIIAAQDDYFDLSKMDVSEYMKNPVVLYNHRRDILPIGKTTELFQDGDVWRAKFKLDPGDEFAQQVDKKWDDGYLQAASIGAIVKWDENTGEPYLVLKEWSITPTPADGSALKEKNIEVIKGAGMLEQFKSWMNKSEETDMAEDTEQVETAEEADLPEGETVPGIEIVGDSSDAGADSDTAQLIHEQALARAELIERAVPFVGPEFQITSLTDNRSILVQATKSFVPEAESRSDDYLYGRLDAEIDRKKNIVDSWTPETSNKLERSLTMKERYELDKEAK